MKGLYYHQRRANEIAAKTGRPAAEVLAVYNTARGDRRMGQLDQMGSFVQWVAEAGGFAAVGLNDDDLFFLKGENYSPIGA